MSELLCLDADDSIVVCGTSNGWLLAFNPETGMLELAFEAHRCVRMTYRLHLSYVYLLFVA